jgi:hypothetical protein
MYWYDKLECFSLANIWRIFQNFSVGYYPALHPIFVWESALTYFDSAMLFTKKNYIISPNIQWELTWVCTLKLFINNSMSKSVCHICPSQIFGFCPKGRLLAMPTIIRLGCKWLKVTNALADYYVDFITTVKSFIKHSSELKKDIFLNLWIENQISHSRFFTSFHFQSPRPILYNMLLF